MVGDEMQERFSRLYFGGTDIPEFDETAALAVRPMTLLQRAVYEKMTPVEREIDYLERLHRLPDTRPETRTR